MNYISTFEAAKRWGISPRRVLEIAKSGRIPGAVKVGSRWLIEENSPKPIDARTKIAKSKMLKSEKAKAKDAKAHRNVSYLFRYAILESNDISSFNPPLSAEEKALKMVFKTFHACEFEKADKILGDLPEKANNKYFRIFANYIGCMIDIYICNISRFLTRYTILSRELQGDFQYKTEMQEYINKIDATLGYYNYYIEDFEIKKGYSYHKSFLPHLSTLSVIRLSIPGVVISEKELLAHEINCYYLDNTDAYDDRQATHVYIATGYALIGNIEKAYYHFKEALILAEKYDLYYIAAEQYSYMQSVFEPILDEFSDTFKRRFLKKCKDGYARYCRFMKKHIPSQMLPSLSQKEYAYIYYSAKGYTNKEMASLFNVSESTVGKTLSNIYALLGVDNKTAMTELYYQKINSGVDTKSILE